MKKLCLVIAVCLGFAAFVNADVYQAGADRLTALQNNDGGWDWPLDDGVKTTTSPVNTIGPIAMGLAQAYKKTGDPAHLAALQKVGNLLLSKSGNFSPSDGYLAVELDGIFGVTTYSDYVKANFYDKLAAGTYQRTGSSTYYTTQSYIDRIRNMRSGSQANMAAWDIGIGLYAANLIGAGTKEWLIATQAEIDELDTNKYYDVAGLAGAILGLASVGADYDPLAGSFAAASSTADLAGMLASMQISNGAFAWNANYVDLGEEAVQETAYAILALKALGGFDSVVAAAQNYLLSVQLSTGGWNDYPSAPTGENNELTGEALWAIPEPATVGILAMGILAVFRKRK